MFSVLILSGTVILLKFQRDKLEKPKEDYGSDLFSEKNRDARFCFLL